MLRCTRLALLTLTLFAATSVAQPAPALDLPRPSPKGSVTQNVGTTEISVSYSSPTVKGRKIWGEVVPLDQVWRAGANDCTKVTFSTPVSIEGKPVPAGAYCIFLLPAKSGWTFILSKNSEQGGTDYKQSEDALRVPATASTIPLRERLAYAILDFDDEKGTLAMEWETQRVAVKFTTGTRDRVLAQIRKLKENWNNVWTRAQLLHAAGKNSEALAAAQRAQTLGKAVPKDEFFAADDVAKALVSWKK